MAQVDAQKRWAEVSPLCSLSEEPQERRKPSMNSEREEENGGEAGDTGDPGHQACPRGSSQGTQDTPDLPWQQPSNKGEENFEKTSVKAWEVQCRERPIEDHPGRPLSQHSTQDLLSTGDDGNVGTKLDATLGILYSFPGPGRYFCAQRGVDTSPDNSSFACVPKQGGSRDLPTQETLTRAQGSPPPARLVVAGMVRARTGLKGHSPGVAGGQGETRPLRGSRAFQKPSTPFSPVQKRGAKPYVSKLCGKACSHRGTLQQHLHTGKRPYCCSFCDKAYTWSSDHRKHLHTHTGEKLYRCPDCSKAFLRSSDLRKHQRNMHSNDKPCARCGQTFKKPLSLLRHQCAHLGKKPLRCPACGKRFTKSFNLIEHQTLHSGQRPFPCTQCGRAFAHSSTLKRHQQVHSGDKGFHCAECGRAFRIALELAQHIRVHIGKRPYQCEVCGQAFTRSSHLQWHRAKHGTCKTEPNPLLL
ncbi:zinc finger protein 648 [Saccopteryx leptura]|uniref:zinc finger protein 648 n=1 Tax=Saccopteryx leptura TaxID=249018 RepID=UPI00339C5D42